MNTTTVNTFGLSPSSIIFSSKLTEELIKQCGKLSTLKSNIAPHDCALLAIMAEALENRETGIPVKMGLPILLKVLRTEFYKQYAARRFDRYIIIMASCEPDHVHKASCIGLFEPPTEKFVGALDNASDEDVMVFGKLQIKVADYRKAMIKAQNNVDLRAKELNIEPQVVIGVTNGDWRQPIFEKMPEVLDCQDRPHMNCAVGTLIELASETSPQSQAFYDACERGVSSQTTTIETEKLIELASETSPQSQAFYDAWERGVSSQTTTIEMNTEPIYMNSACETLLTEKEEAAEMYKKRRSFEEMNERRKRHHVAAAYLAKNAEKRSRQSVKERNRDYRESCKIFMNGLVDRVKKGKETLDRVNAMVDQVDTILETAETWKDWIKKTTTEMMPQLVATITRWMLQPPTFLALCLDLFVLIERVAPERVRQGFYWFISSATALKEQAIAHRSRLASIRNRAGSERVYMQSAKKDEALERASWITCIAELMTNVRLKDRVKNVCKLAMTLGKTMRDVNSYRKAIKELIKPVMDFLSNYLRLSILDKMFKRVMTDADLTQFVEDVEKLRGYGDQEIAASTFPHEVNALWNTAVKVRRILVEQKLDPQVYRELHFACEALSKFRAQHYVALQNSWGAVRKTPFVVALVGASGCGKSDVAPMLAKDMCHPGNCNMDVATTNISDLIYFYSGIKHWDGYRGQPVCFWDDFGQKKEDANTTAEESNYLWFIKLISGVQVPLPMAHLDQKGMYFNSPLTILTQNEIYPVPTSIVCPEAAQLRVNVRCYVTEDKSNPFEPIYPEEAITYDNGYVEQRNQFMQYHVLPSVLKKGPTVVSTQNMESLPKHGDPKGMSYTQFLKYCVDKFNQWQETSSVERMKAPTPASRIFNTGVPPVDRGTKPNRFQPEKVNMNGLFSTWFGKEEKSQQGYQVRVAEDDAAWSSDEEDPNPYEYMDGNTSFEDTANPESFFGKLMSFTGLSSMINSVAEFLNFSREFTARLYRWSPVVFAMAVALWIFSMFGALYLLWNQEDSDMSVMYTKEDVDKFCDTTDLLIRDDMRLMLYDIANQLEREKISANMAANGYDSKVLKSKAARVVSGAYVQKMSEKIKMNSGLENNTSVEHLIYNNMRVIRYHNGDGAMQAIGIVGRYMLCNAHFFILAEYANKIVDGYCELRTSINGVDEWLGHIDMRHVKIYKDMDIAIFQLPKHRPQFKDVRKHFISETEFGKTDNVPVRMLTVFKRCRSSRTIAKLNKNELTYEFHHDSNITVTVAHSYIMELTDFSYGDCGGPMIVEHLNKISAIHAASSKSWAYAVPVYKELFDNLSADYAEQPPIIEMNAYSSAYEEVEPVGVVQPQWRNFVQNKTNIRPSPVHGMVAPVTKEPSVKTLKDVRVSDEAKRGLEPMIKSFRQYYDPSVDIKPHIMRKAMIAVSAVLATIKPTIQLGRRLLTGDEVLNGSDGVYPPLNIHTSAGMPQRTYAPGKPGKTAFFRRTIDDKLEWADSAAACKFKADYVEYEKSLRSGVIPFVFLMETLKDETLKIEKIENAKTRTFEVFPGPLAMVYRKYFGAFNAALQADCMRKPVSVGINAHSVQWKFLYDRLNRFGGKVIAGDYVAWDKRLCGQAIYKATVQVNEWYERAVLDNPNLSAEDRHRMMEEIAQDNEVRLLLAQILINSYVVVMEILFRTSQGLPSGVPVTSVLNSVANWLYLVSAIFSILEEKNVLQDMLPDELNKHVEFALYGDDHIIALSAELRQFITFQDVRNHFRSRLVGYTDANKNAISEFDFEELTDVTFLKRKFRPENGRVYAPLDKSSVEDQLNWINHTDSMNRFAIFAQCFKGFQIEAHLHGKYYFEMMTDRLRAALEGHASPLKECALAELSSSDYKEFWRCYNNSYSSI